MELNAALLSGDSSAAASGSCVGGIPLADVQFSFPDVPLCVLLLFYTSAITSYFLLLLCCCFICSFIHLFSYFATAIVLVASLKVASRCCLATLTALAIGQAWSRGDSDAATKRGLIGQ